MSFRRPRTAEEILMLDEDERPEDWPEGEDELVESEDDGKGSTTSRFYDEDDSDPDDPWLSDED